MSGTGDGHRPDGTPGRGGGRKPTFDPFDNVPELVPLRTAARAGDWPAVRAHLTRLESADQLVTAASALAEVPGVETFLEKAAADLPADPLPRTLLAERYIQIGWQVRGRATAEHVSREQFDRFHDWLRRAELLLIEVCAEQPAYAPAWTARLLTALGLGLGQAEARRRYDRLRAHHPHPYAAQSRLLQQLCPKWGGSWEAAHAFARECAVAAPDGAVNAALVAQAHLEQWLDLEDLEGRAYLRGVPVRDDLRNAAQVSVLHPAHRPGWDSVGAHSAFAMAFSLGGHFADAAPHFAFLGDRASDHPWRYLSDAGTAFRKFRKSALSAAA
ncbi:hypothetical protein [Streptomyces sp. bgisy154]|uniref:hypothetical protein n=1 Tax=Streptomyces sp. bgisy154 TaxID=3413794 RepID=UPI003D73D9FD